VYYRTIEPAERAQVQTTETAAIDSPRLVLNVPNGVTGFRVVLAAVIAYLLYRAEPHTIVAAGILLLIAAFTDTIDGFLARKLGQGTLGGALFDLVADEVLFMPAVVLATRAGLFARTDDLVPLNPYLYAIPALAGGVAVLSGVSIYLWKRRTRAMEFPSRPAVVQATYWFWLAALITAVLRIGPIEFLAALMLLSLIFTILSFYVYLKEGSYVFTD
jgi:phosphatidylglycerophosphate synthase